MQSVWHSACLRALERSLRRKALVCSLPRSFSTSSPWSNVPRRDLAMEEFPCDVIRNFSIIAHIGRKTNAKSGLTEV
ncbi:hypothetical protein BDZ97DRAFT_1813020, partial [Flammula alnicola]